MLAALVMFGAVGIVLGGFIWLGIAMERRRDKAMQRAAAGMGWSFTSECDVETVRALAGDLPLFEHGHTREAERMMQGRRGGHDVAVVDYCWHDGQDTARITKQQTVALFLGAGASLPHFAIERAGAARSITGMLHEKGWSETASFLDSWMDEVLTPGRPQIGGRYTLRAADPAAARKALGGNLVELLSSAEDWQLQSCGKALAVFRTGTYVPAEGLEELLTHGERFADALGAN